MRSHDMRRGTIILRAQWNRNHRRAPKLFCRRLFVTDDGLASSSQSAVLCDPGSDTAFGFRLPLRPFPGLTHAFKCGGLAGDGTAGLGRRLGPGWFAERLHEDALVTNLENLQLLGAGRRAKNDEIAGLGLHQSACERRHPADVVSIEVDLVEAD